MFDARPCLFCLNPSTARLGLDKRGRPFVHCCACGARTFMPSFSPCLHGLAVLSPFVQAINAEMTADREGWMRHAKTIRDFLEALKTQINPATIAAPVESTGLNAQPAPVSTSLKRSA